MDYRISKGIAGTSVLYDCPACGTGLRSPLKNAGNEDTCPDCQAVFLVPGMKEKQEAESQEVIKALDKELKHAERDRQRAEKREQEGLQQQELAAREKERRIEQADIERARREAMAGATFAQSDHDWSLGGPYVYDCFEIGTLSQDWQSHLQSLLNKKASEGWEYWRSESLIASKPNGCLAAFLGNPTTEISVVVLVFRRPSSIVARERALSNTIR